MPDIAASPPGYQILNDSLKNKGTAFSLEERERYGLFGLIPPGVETLDLQVNRRLQVLRSFDNDLERYAYLRELQDNNEVLFYRLIVDNIEEFLPIVYTPTVGAGCQQFSRLYRKARGLFLSPPYAERIEAILANPRFDGVEAIVVTDGERILGLGDQGAGGMGIPIGKLALYSACGGIHPAKTLPIMLDTGTDNADRLADPLYIGWRHERIRGDEYDAFIETFVSAVAKRWPNVLLQFEDFAKANASRLLEKYRDRLCTFNDDIQGTAAVATGTVLSAIPVTGTPFRDQRIVMFGAGSAGCGIAALLLQAMIDTGLSAEDAVTRFFLIDSDGLLLEDDKNPTPAQMPFLRKKSTVEGWKLDRPGKIGLADVVRNVHPTVLIGVSGQPNSFSEAVIKDMAAHVERPMIFPLSNPTSQAEAKPVDIEAWTNGKALIGTGSPFPPLERDGRRYPVDQTNNSYIFPGVGLGVLASKARRVSDTMFMVAAKALADASPVHLNAKSNLLPPASSLRDVAMRVALAVARQAKTEGHSDIDANAIEDAVRAAMWTPAYE